MTHSRRDFLRLMSATTAAGMAATTMPLHAMGVTAPVELFPEVTEAMLRELALRAIDEARRAGASFADVRLGAAHGIQFTAAQYRQGQGVDTVSLPSLQYNASFGIRAIVNGAWGFSGGYLVTPDAIVQGARLAVESARANRPRHRQAIELAPEPAVKNGFWEMPIERDPFTVPILEQLDAAAAALEPLATMPKIVEGEIGVAWRKCTAVFASTEGSLIVQRLATAMPGGEVKAIDVPGDWNTLAQSPITTIRVGPYGYEALGVVTLAEGVRAAAERAIEGAKARRKVVTADVGRYDLVFGTNAVAGVLAETIAAALSLPRALGYEANGVGTSFAAPPLDFLGRSAIAAPMITMRGDRTQEKGASTVAWDDEGVKPTPYTFVENGIVTDYHNNRQTAVEVGTWYQSRGKPVRAQGLARGIGRVAPDVALPNLTMEPGPAAISIDDLIGDTKRGYLVLGCGGRADQQVINIQFAGTGGGVRKITNGKLGPHVEHFSFQFITQPFWKSVMAIGGAASSRPAVLLTHPWAIPDVSQPFPYSTVRTVPMRVRNVNVLNTGRTA